MKRRVAIGGAVVAALLIAAGLWVGLRGLAARRELLAARAGISALRHALLSGHQAAAQADLAAVQRETRAASSDTTDPVWSVAAHLPFVGASVAATRTMAATVNTLAGNVLPALVATGDTISPGKLRVGGATLRLAPLQAAAPVLATADTEVSQALARLQRVPAAGLLGPVRRARAQLLGLLTGLGGQLDAASRFASVGPALLGAGGPREYFVALQNNAEARGTGGLVGAFAIIRADHGHVQVVRLGSDTDLANAPSPVVNLGPQFAALYGGYQSEQAWKSSNISPNFPAVAQIWAGLWQAQTGQRVAGVIAVDPIALAGLLTVTGPATLPDGEQLTGANAVSFLEQTINVRYPVLADQAARKALLVTAAHAAFHRLLSGSGNAQALARAFGHAAGSGDLLFWARRPAEEAAVSGTPLAGALVSTTAPYDSVVVNNAGGDKLDYYLHRTVSWTEGGCAGRVRDATVTVALTNGAPASGLPPYVTERQDKPVGPYPVGQSNILLSVYATDGAQLVGVTLNGVPTTLSPGVEQGHPVFSTNVYVDPGATATLVLHLVEPVTAGQPIERVQPLVIGQQTSVSVPPCG
ncbi:MAG: DUF4012 domain-containing protein [Mycobacteriales bacterium]